MFDACKFEHGIRGEGLPPLQRGGVAVLFFQLRVVYGLIGDPAVEIGEVCQWLLRSLGDAGELGQYAM